MVKRSEGVNRIVKLISIAAVLVAISGSVISLVDYIYYTGHNYSQVGADIWLAMAAAIFFSFFTPIWLKNIIYWVIDGFNSDKQS